MEVPCGPADLKLAAKIEMKRRIEEERRPRIFNVRQRLIGVDKEALEKQIRERREREEDERRQHEAFEKKRLHDDEIALRIEKHIDEEKRKLNKELNDFRVQYQKPEARREYDLNDPHFLKKDHPPCHDELKCGISSAQRFEGEDEHFKERNKLQKQQVRSFLEQQMTERKTAEQLTKFAEREWADTLTARDKHALELEKLEQECRRRIDEATLQYNKALAEELASNRRQKAIRDIEDSQAEIYNALTGDLLQEKGLNAEEILKIRQSQLEQIQEKKKREEEEKHLNEQWIELANGLDRHALIAEKEIMRRQRELDKQIREQNILLAKEQQAHKEYIEKLEFINKPSDEFYNQFNKTTR